MKRVSLWMIGLLFACFCACSAPSEPVGTTVDGMEDGATAPSMQPEAMLAAEESLEPLSYMRAEQEYGDSGFISYPYLMDPEYDAMNLAIQSAIRSTLDVLNRATYTHCEITCNLCGLFSVRIAVYDLGSNELLAIVPMTFRAADCAQLTLGDLFDPENERWRGLIPDIVMLQAEKDGLTLLCDVMPAADDQGYYLTADALVLVYRPYEITTYSAGWPEFSIPLNQLVEFFQPGSAPMRLISDGTSGMLEEQNKKAEGELEPAIEEKGTEVALP